MKLKGHDMQSMIPTFKEKVKMYGRTVRIVQFTPTDDILVQEFLDGVWQKVRTFNANDEASAIKAAVELQRFWW